MAPPLSPDRRPTMAYWISENGTIVRAESRNADMVAPGDGVFAEPFHSCAVVGRNLFQFIDGSEVRHLYQTLGERVLKTGRTIAFPYRCDSPVIRREMTMRMSRDSMLIRYDSAVVRETPKELEIPKQTTAAVTLVAICSFCQKFRFPVTSRAWRDLENLPTEAGLPSEFKFTHGICDECYAQVLHDADLDL
jgi:hypothetical protein